MRSIIINMMIKNASLQQEPEVTLHTESYCQSDASILKQNDQVFDKYDRQDEYLHQKRKRSHEKMRYAEWNRDLWLSKLDNIYLQNVLSCYDLLSNGNLLLVVMFGQKQRDEK